MPLTVEEVSFSARRFSPFCFFTALVCVVPPPRLRLGVAQTVVVVPVVLVGGDPLSLSSRHAGGRLHEV